MNKNIKNIYKKITAKIIFLSIFIFLTLLFSQNQEQRILIAIATFIYIVTKQIDYIKTISKKIEKNVFPFLLEKYKYKKKSTVILINFFAQQIRTPKLKQIVNYIFISFLFLVIAGQFVDRLPSNFNWLIKIYQSTNNYLISFTLVSGFFVFFLNREKIKEVEIEQNEEEKKEEERKKEFVEKFPRINKIPVLRNLVKWAYKEGWKYSIITTTLIIIGFFLRLYNLGKLSLWWDELITGTYVTRILETGLPLFPSDLGYYWRGVAYHYLVSIFSLIFENTEFWLRFPSVLFGMGIILMTFFLTKKINKKVAIIVLAFLIFSTYNIEYSRFARFYVMNAFLFMVAIWFFWKGFFKNNLKYKIASLVIFSLMLHTVQFGLISVSLIATWFFFLGIKLIQNLNRIKALILENKDNLFFMLWFIPVYYFNNFFEKYIKIKTTMPLAKEVIKVTPPQPWNYFQIPDWKIFNFYNDNYFPIILIIPTIIYSTFLFFKHKNKKIELINYITTLSIISIIIYEVSNRDVTGARIYFIFEALLIILSFTSLHYLIVLFIKNKNVRTIFFSLIVIILFFNITPNFYKRINLEYGDKITKDPFRTTSVAAYRSDYGTTYKYIEKNKKENDIIIVVMSPNYFYLKNIPNFILNQNNRWNTNSIINKNKYFISKENASILINTVDNIKEIIQKNKNKKIWLIANGGSMNIIETLHVKKDFIEFIKENQKNVVYKSPDGLSSVLLFNNDKKN
ncbi:MAG: glycosyltransferase family 39 protein [Candidatus Magasanikiibacteriota bacterium]